MVHGVYDGENDELGGREEEKKVMFVSTYY